MKKEKPVKNQETVTVTWKHICNMLVFGCAHWCAIQKRKLSNKHSLRKHFPGWTVGHESTVSVLKLWPESKTFEAKTNDTDNKLRRTSTCNKSSLPHFAIATETAMVFHPGFCYFEMMRKCKKETKTAEKETQGSFRGERVQVSEGKWCGGNGSLRRHWEKNWCIKDDAEEECERRGKGMMRRGEGETRRTMMTNGERKMRMELEEVKSDRLIDWSHWCDPAGSCALAHVETPDLMYSARVRVRVCVFEFMTNEEHRLSLKGAYPLVVCACACVRLKLWAL